MKRFYHILAILVLFMPTLTHSQETIAQQAYAIVEQKYLMCHGEFGTFKDELLIERDALIDTGVVIPGNPDDSEFYKRLLGPTDTSAQMSLEQPPLSDEAIVTIRHWIAAGAPDWNVSADTEKAFITTETMMNTIQAHVTSLAKFDRQFARYFTLTHLYNAGENDDTLRAYRDALAKLVNSLSWGAEVINPQPIDAFETLFYIDLWHYEWDVRNDAWTQIEEAYPYRIEYDTPIEKDLREKLIALRQAMQCSVPYVQIDWLLATASLPPLYHEILSLPQTDIELEGPLEVDVAQNITNAPGVRLARRF